jgi:hypothetical protein
MGVGVDDVSLIATMTGTFAYNRLSIRQSACMHDIRSTTDSSSLLHPVETADSGYAGPWPDSPCTVLVSSKRPVGRTAGTDTGQ